MTSPPSGPTPSGPATPSGLSGTSRQAGGIRRGSVREARLPPPRTLLIEEAGETKEAEGGAAGAAGIRLRSWRPGDAPAVARGLADPEFRRWNTPKLPVETEADAREWMRNRTADLERGSACVLAVTTGDLDEVIGGVGLGVLDLWSRRGAVGYWVLPEERGRGVARRALGLFTRWAFAEVGLHRLALRHAVGHEASCQVAERCGYAYEGTLRGGMFEAGDTSRFRDAHQHARLVTDV